MEREVMKRQSIENTQAEYENWVSSSQRIARAMISDDRPGCGSLLLTLIAFVQSNHVNDEELLTLSQSLSSRALKTLPEKVS